MGNSKLKNYLTKTFTQWPLQKNKLSKVSLTKSGRPTMLTSPVPSTRKKPRNSYRTPLETSDQEMSSPMRLSMRSSPPSTRTDQVPLRRTKWLYSSSNSSVETERVLKDQDSYNEDQCQPLGMEAR